ncbi:hypothetical protein NMY22_g3385 [Coprinellus aureogranulatus]|nr:hypothetical protein NMY22_g3385 [Coprinellus aureogranulatus]
MFSCCPSVDPSLGPLFTAGFALTISRLQQNLAGSPPRFIASGSYLEFESALGTYDDGPRTTPIALMSVRHALLAIFTLFFVPSIHKSVLFYFSWPGMHGINFSCASPFRTSLSAETLSLSSAASQSMSLVAIRKACRFRSTVLRGQPSPGSDQSVTFDDVRLLRHPTSSSPGGWYLADGVPPSCRYDVGNRGRHAPGVAREFYEYLLEHGLSDGGSGFDTSLCAHPLRHATQKLRQRLGDSNSELVTWIPQRTVFLQFDNLPLPFLQMNPPGFGLYCARQSKLYGPHPDTPHCEETLRARWHGLSPCAQWLYELDEGKELMSLEQLERLKPLKLAPALYHQYRVEEAAEFNLPEPTPVETYNDFINAPQDVWCFWNDMVEEFKMDADVVEDVWEVVKLMGALTPLGPELRKSQSPPPYSPRCQTRDNTAVDYSQKMDSTGYKVFHARQTKLYGPERDETLRVKWENLDSHAQLLYKLEEDGKLISPEELERLKPLRSARHLYHQFHVEYAKKFSLPEPDFDATYEYFISKEQEAVFEFWNDLVEEIKWDADIVAKAWEVVNIVTGAYNIRM